MLNRNQNKDAAHHHDAPHPGVYYIFILYCKICFSSALVAWKTCRQQVGFCLSLFTHCLRYSSRHYSYGQDNGRIKSYFSRWCNAPLALLVRFSLACSHRLQFTFALLPGFRRSCSYTRPIPCGLPVPFYLITPWGLRAASLFGGGFPDVAEGGGFEPPCFPNCKIC